MGLRRIQGGFGAPTRAVSLARFLAGGVTLISYSWLGRHTTHPKLQLPTQRPRPGQHCPQL